MLLNLSLSVLKKLKANFIGTQNTQTSTKLIGENTERRVEDIHELSPRQSLDGVGGSLLQDPKNKSPKVA
jgi:hypothetical protein